MSSGGRREGSGRKSKFGEKTVVLRVPESILEFVQKQIDFVQIQKNSDLSELDNVQIQSEIVQNQIESVRNQDFDIVQNQQLLAIKELIESYKANVTDSPRWAQAKKLLKELDLILTK